MKLKELIENCKNKNIKFVVFEHIERVGDFERVERIKHDDLTEEMKQQEVKFYEIDNYPTASYKYYVYAHIEREEKQKTIYKSDLRYGISERYKEVHRTMSCYHGECYYHLFVNLSTGLISYRLMSSENDWVEYDPNEKARLFWSKARSDEERIDEYLECAETLLTMHRWNVIDDSIENQPHDPVEASDAFKEIAKYIENTYGNLSGVDIFDKDGKPRPVYDILQDLKNANKTLYNLANPMGDDKKVAESIDNLFDLDGLKLEPRTAKDVQDALYFSTLIQRAVAAVSDADEPEEDLEDEEYWDF